MAGWKKNLWLLWLSQLISISSFGFGLPFIPLYIQELQALTYQELTLYATILSAAPALTMGFMAPIWGYLSDKHGRKLMILRASFSGAIIVAMMGMITSINQFLLLRFLQGFFTGTITASTAFVASDAPEEELGYSMGVITSGNFVGFSLGPLLGGFFAKYFGYRTSYLLGGSMLFLSFLIVYFFVKEDRNKLIVKTETSGETVFKSYASVMTPVVISTLCMYFFLRISRTAFSPYLPIYVQSYISDESSVPMITGIINGLTSLVTAISSILIGKMSQRFESIRLLKSTIILSLISSISLSFIVLNSSGMGGLNALIPFIVNYVLFFLLIGGIEPTITSISAASVSANHRGALFGLQGTVGSIAWFTGPLISGTIAYNLDINHVIPVMSSALLLMLASNFILGKIIKKQPLSKEAA